MDIIWILSYTAILKVTTNELIALIQKSEERTRADVTVQQAVLKIRWAC